MPTPTLAPSPWYRPLLAVESKGSQIDPVGGLAGLAAARELHQGQFFTPLEVVAFMWRVCGLEHARVRHGSIHVFDGCFGSGRMFAFADPKVHVLHGIEVDQPLVSQVVSVAATAGFRTNLHVGSMVDFRLDERGGYGSRDRFHFGLINPPFSIHIDSPIVSQAWASVGTWGRYGAHSSTVSHRLAVQQALEWCDVVAAVVPRTFADVYVEQARKTANADRWSKNSDYDPCAARLHRVYHLPRSAFKAEGADVLTSVMVWEERARLYPSSLRIHELGSLSDKLASDDVLAREIEYGCSASLIKHDAPAPEPSRLGRCNRLAELIAAGKLDAPAGERRLQLSHDGRKLTVQASDAATYVRGMNELLGERHRASAHEKLAWIKYQGQGRLDLEVWLAQDDPHAAFANFTARLAAAAGCRVDVSPTLARYFAKRVRQVAIMREPFRHTIHVEDGGFGDWFAQQERVRVRIPRRTLTKSLYTHRDPRRFKACVWCQGTGRYPGPDHECHYCDEGNAPDFDRHRCVRIVSEEVVFDRVPAGKNDEKDELHWRPDEMVIDCGKDDDGKLRHQTVSWMEKWTGTQLRELGNAVDVFPDFTPGPNGWLVKHEGKALAFPQEHARIVARAKREGVDKWLWSYQFADLCEIGMLRGAIIAWEMGLGKARLAAALCLLGGKHNLITVETRLIREMEAEFKSIGLPASTWQTITKPEQCSKLRRINLISYDKLKSTLPGYKRPKPEAPKEGEPKPKDKPRTYDVRHTFAGLLRRRIHTHVCDEGHLLRSPTTQQTRAVYQVSAKGPRYLLTGTPIANYPKDVLHLLQWVGGDGTASQHYGNHRPLMLPANVDTYGAAPRGVDDFRERFVTLKWVTHEYADELQEGAKREVPVIADVPGFRKIVRHLIKRRVAAEPDVAQHVKIPVPTREVVPVAWDADHLDYYLETARTFIAWYEAELKRAREERGEDAKNVRLVAVLQNLQAVAFAANYPQGGVGGQPAWEGGMTSKQRRAIERVQQWVAEGRKVITYCKSPALAEFLADALEEQGIDVVQFHGGISITKRVDALDKRFREGNAQVLCATKGCLQTGYNLACASRVLHVDGEWTPTVVRQADARVLRPQQRRDVLIEYLHLPGSIDAYQWQMTEQKGATMAAGLDYGNGPGDAEFKHLDAILAEFCRNIDTLKASASG